MCCLHSALLSLEHASLNTGTIRSEMIIDVRVLRCISVLTGCGHAGVHLPPPPSPMKETTSLAHQLYSTARAYWLYCSGKQNKSTLTDLPEQWAPQSSILSERNAFYARLSWRQARCPSAGQLVSQWHTDISCHSVSAKRKKRSVQTFGCVTISHMTWLSYHLKSYRGESCQRENRDQASYRP